jgi:Fic family protein
MARTYEETHPWINFELDTSCFDYKLWMALGEAASKCEHVAGVPLAPEVADSIHQLYLAKGAAATTAIEGNTLTEDEAGKIISGKLKLPPSQKYLEDEVNNIVDAVNDITAKINSDGAKCIDVNMIKSLNISVLRNLSCDEDTVPGEIRSHKVIVGKYRCAPPQDCGYLLDKFCDVLNSFPLTDEHKLEFSIIKAIFAHLYFVWIHPFGDGNGRTARLIEFYILMSAGFPQPTCHILSNHYNKTRSNYYKALDDARKSHDHVIKFIKYSVDGLVDGLKEQIEFIRHQQWSVAWINYVHEHFHDKNSPTDVRRRHIVLALSKNSEPIPISKISMLTADLAREYHGKTPKTVNRDINALIEMDLIEKRRGKTRAKREIILAFLPWRNAVNDEI